MSLDGAACRLLGEPLSNNLQAIAAAISLEYTQLLASHPHPNPPPPSGTSGQTDVKLCSSLLPVSASETFIGQGVHCNNECVFIVGVNDRYYVICDFNSSTWASDGLLAPPTPRPHVPVYIKVVLTTRTVTSVNCHHTTFVLFVLLSCLRFCSHKATR